MFFIACLVFFIKVIKVLLYRFILDFHSTLSFLPLSVHSLHFEISMGIYEHTSFSELGQKKIKNKFRVLHQSMRFIYSGKKDFENNEAL